MATNPIYYKRRAAGLCPRCGRRPPMQGRSACGVCLVWKARRQRQLAARRKTFGLCLRCGMRPAARWGVHCWPCTLGKHEEYEARKAQREAPHAHTDDDR